ncbi:MAG TPA: SprT family zinc-dependent metalloprotease [Ktedonobacterales bacterium]
MPQPPKPPRHPTPMAPSLWPPANEPCQPTRPRPGARQGTRLRTASDAPQSHSVTLGGRHIPYTLKVSARARRLRLIVRPGSGLEVVVPRGAPLSAHEPFLREKEQWILTTLDRIARETAAAAPAPLITGRRLPFAGRELTLVVRADGPAGRYRVGLSGDTLTVTLPGGDQEQARVALEMWYRRQAAVIFADRLQIGNRAYGFTYQRVSIKEQKSRWGSCSKLGNLNFNWRLLLAPLPVLDYVVVHELCHLKELNHGPRFWKLVGRGCPDYAVHRRWLRLHGRELKF